MKLVIGKSCKLLIVFTTLHIEMRFSKYYTLKSSLQILRSALLDDRSSRAGDSISGSVLSRGSILSKQLHVFECIHVVYCRRGYFRWGKFSRKCWQDISRGGNFHDSTHISFIKAYGFYFRVGVIFAKKTK